MQRKPHKKTNEADKDPFKELEMFGGVITLDNVNILNPKRASRHDHRTMCALMDRFTGWMEAIASPDRTQGAIIAALQQRTGRKDNCDMLYFDNANEYIAAAKFLQIR